MKTIPVLLISLLLLALIPGAVRAAKPGTDCVIQNGWQAEEPCKDGEKWQHFIWTVCGPSRVDRKCTDDKSCVSDVHMFFETNTQLPCSVFKKKYEVKVACCDGFVPQR